MNEFLTFARVFVDREVWDTLIYRADIVRRHADIWIGWLIVSANLRQGKCEQYGRDDARDRTDVIPSGPFVQVLLPEIMSLCR